MMKMTVIDMMNRIAQAVQDLDAAKPGEERESRQLQMQMKL